MKINGNRLHKKNQQFQKKYGPWALVTGASDGIGREFAHNIANAGMNLVLNARRKKVLEGLAGSLWERYGIQTKVIDADLAGNTGVQRVIEETQGLDIGLLVASAGFGTSGNFIDSPLARELEMLDINCGALMKLTHVFGRRFAKRRGGGIVLMSSIVAFQGVSRAANYAATKAYVQTLAEGLSIELAPYGVDVVASAPGPVHSGFAKRANMQMGMALKPESVARETLSALGLRSTVRPGWLSKILKWAMTIPRWARIRIMTIIMNGMTKHQRELTVSERSGGA